MKGGVRLYITKQYMQWRVVWDFTSHNTTLNEGWRETLHHQTIHAMKGGVRLYITKAYMQGRVVWDFTSPNNTCNEGWCETLNHQTIHAWRVVWDFTSEVGTKGSGVFADRIGMAAWLLSSGVAMCVQRRRFATWCCETHCNGCMNVAWGLFRGGSWSTKPCGFPCKVAAACDERYLMSAAGAAAVVPSVIGSSSVFCKERLFMCA